ncbi:hypothetical protein [Streptomyces sp. NPDC058579]|uniref:hypothetical protein n=1 Tax=Streptomyces sp. NPDC058579 TaxID=3346548 RepID=UPI003666E76C
MTFMICAGQAAAMKTLSHSRSFRLGALAVLPVLLGVAACGDDTSSDDGVATAQTAPAGGVGKDDSDAAGSPDTLKELQDAYVACMRKNGIKFPDAKPGEGLPQAGADSGYYDSSSQDGRSELGRRAEKACKPQAAKAGEALDKAAKDPKAQAESEKKFREYANCLRGKGVEVNDPKDGGSLFDDPAKALEDPKFKAADPVCRQKAYGTGAQG